MNGVAHRGCSSQATEGFNVPFTEKVPLAFVSTRGHTFRCRITPIGLASRCHDVTTIRVGQEFHHFVERGNVELCN